MGGLISRIFRRKTLEDESRPKSKKGRRFGSFRRPKSEEPQTSIHQSRCNTLPSRTPISQIESGQTIEREERRRETMLEVQDLMGTASQLSDVTGKTAQIPRIDEQKNDQNIAQGQLGATEQTEENINSERCATLRAVPLASEAPNQNNYHLPTSNMQTMWTTEQNDMVQQQMEASSDKTFIVPDEAEIAQITNEVQHDIAYSKTQPESTTDDSDLVHVEYHANAEAEYVNSDEPGIQKKPSEILKEMKPDWTTREEHTIHAVTKECVEATPHVAVGEEDAEIPSELQHETPTHEAQPEWTTEHEDGVHLESDARVVSTSDMADDAETAQLSGQMEHEISTGDTQPELTTEYDDTVHAVSDSHVEATPHVAVGEEDAEVPSELQHETPTHEAQPEWTTEHGEERPADVPYDVLSDTTQYGLHMAHKEASSLVGEHPIPGDFTDMGYSERSTCETVPDLIANPSDAVELGDDELRLSDATNIIGHPTIGYAESLSSLQVVSATCPENISSVVSDTVVESNPSVTADNTGNESSPAGLPDVGESRVETTDEAEDNICGDQNSPTRHMLSFPDEFTTETPLVGSFQYSSNDKPTDEERLLDSVSSVHSVAQGNAFASDGTVSTGVIITSEVESKALPDANLTSGFDQWTPTTSDLIVHSLVDDVLDHAACSVPDDTADSDLRMTEEHVYHDDDSTLLNNSESPKLHINGDYSPSLNGSNHKSSLDKEHLEPDVAITTTKQLDLPSSSEYLDKTPQESTPNPLDA